jgi:hypothetical protein
MTLALERRAPRSAVRPCGWSGCRLHGQGRRRHPHSRTRGEREQEQDRGKVGEHSLVPARSDWPGAAEVTARQAIHKTLPKPRGCNRQKRSLFAMLSGPYQNHFLLVRLEESKLQSFLGHSRLAEPR